MSEKTTKVRSTTLLSNLKTKKKTAMTAIGMATYRVNPKISEAAAMPANSVAVSSVLMRKSSSIAMNEMRTPKLSRNSAASPLPVTQPIRVAISCTMMSATASGTSSQSRL